MYESGNSCTCKSFRFSAKWKKYSSVPVKLKMFNYNLFESEFDSIIWIVDDYYSDKIWNY